MKCTYCPQCGTKTSLKDIGDEGPTPYCQSCNKALLDLPSPGVLVVALNCDEQVPLLKQHYITEEHSVLVAGYAKAGETIEQTVIREVKEETGLSVTGSRYVASYYHERTDALLLGFMAHVDGELSAGSSEVDDLKWVELARADALLRPGSIGIAHCRRVKDFIRGRERS